MFLRRRLVGPAFLAASLLAVPACPGRPEPATTALVLVTVETFRADHLGATVDGVPLTPRLDALAARGTVFDTAYAASSFTLPSLHTILTGESPPVHRVRFWTHFGNLFTAPTLAERLRDEGFDTACFTSGYGDLSAYPLLSRGFASTLHVVQRPAEEMLLPFAKWLDDPARGRRLFAWIHLVEPHTPYGPEERFCEGLLDVGRYRAAGPAPWPVERWLPRVPGPQPELLADRLYAAEVRAADDAVGRVLGELDRRGLTARTLVCVVADHGENLSADPQPRWDHGTSCDEQQVRVPLLLAGPGVPAGRRDAAIARHLDLAPTFLAALGVEGAEDLPGRDLLSAAPAPAPAFAITEGTTFANQEAPFYSVTDGKTSLRIFTDAVPARAYLRREPTAVGGRVEVDLSSPPPGAAAHAAAWRAYAEENIRRAAERNAPGDDRARLTDAQRRVLEIGGYLGGR